MDRDMFFCSRLHTKQAYSGEVATASTYASLTGGSPGFSAVYNGGALQTNTKLWTVPVPTPVERSSSMNILQICFATEVWGFTLQILFITTLNPLPVVIAKTISNQLKEPVEGYPLVDASRSE